MVLATWLGSLKSKAHGWSQAPQRSGRRRQASRNGIESLEQRTLLSVTPVADLYTTNEDSVVTDAAPGVLANDDTSGLVGTAQVQLVTGPAEGTLELNSDGSLSYDPTTSAVLQALKAGQSSTQTFTYTVTDTGDNSVSAEATVSILVSGVNDAPASSDDLYQYTPGTPLVVAAPGVLANDSDAEGDSFTAQLLDTVSSGTLTLNPDGSFTYTPNAGFSGTDSFTYQATDGTSLGDFVTVTLAPNIISSVPTAGDDAYATAPDTPLASAAPGVLGNDSDPDNDPLTAQLVDNAANGALTLNSDGSFSYTPNTGFTGTDTFTYQASDGTNLSNTATVTITVGAPVNQPPVANSDAYTAQQDSGLTIAAPGVLTNDSDTENDPLTVQLVDDVTHGTLLLNANGSFVYVPSAGYLGTDTFTYQASDGTNLSNTATATITVGPVVNDPPVALDNAYTTAHDTPLAIPALGVLANDSDPEDDPLTAHLIDTVTNGTLALNADGSFSYTPNAGFAGTDSFTYQASDGTNLSNTATVTITVTPPSANTSTFDVNTSTLTITNTSGDTAISVGVSNGNLAVLFDGTPDDSFGTVPANTVVHLVINAGPGNNFIDLRDMDLGSFTALTSVSVNGGDGDDSIAGSQIGDSIDAGAGNDYVNAKGGRDTVEGGSGDDIVLGGGARDSLDGGDGNDQMSGNGCDDTIKGGAGNDSIRGADGNDVISGDDGNDRIIGGLGKDSIAGNAGNDTLVGSDGNDVLLGGADDDILAGQAGLDTLSGGGGNDSFINPDNLDTIDEAFVESNPALDQP